jgi:kynurenine formamidase
VASKPLSAEEVLGYVEQVSNWGRWGPDDQRGTLNLITDEHRVAAARLVTDGRAVSCARVIRGRYDDPDRTAQLFWLATGEAACHSHEGLPRSQRVRGDMANAAEYLGMVFHGLETTHVDALSHLFYKGRLYNDRAAFHTNAEFGSTWCPITQLADGVVGRGVLLDVPRAQGLDVLPPGHGVSPDELAAAAAAQGVEVGPGDAVLLRTGRWHEHSEVRHLASSTEGARGWHPACIPWLHQRDVAMLGCDWSQESADGWYRELPAPVHVLALVMMGMPLVDNCDLEALAATCADLGRWEFQFVLAPLRVEGGSGSPVNPLAIF